MLHLRIRQLGYGLVGLFKKSEAQKNRMEMLRVVTRWNKQLDPIAFIESGEEPQSGYEPLMRAPRIVAAAT